MRIASEDGSFVVHLASAGPPYDVRFFVFELEIDSMVLGDGQPAIEWTSVAALAGLPAVDDPRVDPDAHRPRAILDLLTSETDEAGLYDRTLAGFGEGLDQYVTRAYLWGDEAIFLFRDAKAPTSEPLMARLKAEELTAIAAAAMAAHTSYQSTRVTR